jgi:hypothetical protein
MSETVTELVDDRDRDEQIFRARVAGISPRRLADQHHMTVADINAIVSRKMIRVTDPNFRIQALALDLEALGMVQSRVLQAAMGGDLAAVHAMIRLMERRSELLALDSPVKLDLTVAQVNAQTSTEEIRSVLDQLLQHQQPKPDETTH